MALLRKASDKNSSKSSSLIHNKAILKPKDLVETNKKIEIKASTFEPRLPTIAPIIPLAATDTNSELSVGSVATPEFIGDRDVREVVRLVLSNQNELAQNYVVRLREQGARIEDIFLYVLAPAAHSLGQMWEDDTCDFIAVAMASGNLISIMRGLALGHSRFYHGKICQDTAGNPVVKNRYNILIATLDHENHVFGGLMVAEFFRLGGWEVETLVPPQKGEFDQMIASDYFDVVAISVASTDDVDLAKKRIKTTRAISKNPKVIIAVGGGAFKNCKSVADTVGADFSATSGEQAVFEATLRVSKQQMRFISKRRVVSR